jgi:hypothetical protein
MLYNTLKRSPTDPRSVCNCQSLFVQFELTSIAWQGVIDILVHAVFKEGLELAPPSQRTLKTLGTAIKLKPKHRVRWS